jgi:antibiotic biosynthesis monooxygenase (ABM) superfamily enzyme
MEGATAVITHRIRPGQHAAYERYVDEISPRVESAPGYLDRHWIRPVPGLTETYTIIIRFDTPKNLKAWMTSPDRTHWIEKVRPLLVTGDDFRIRSGLDFWFTPEGAQAEVPVRWKQFLVTWSAIFPLAWGLPFLLGPLFAKAGWGGNRILMTAAVTGVAVWLMVYLVMPRYTRLVKRWLFSPK